MANLDDYLRAEAKKLREKDAPPKTRDEWDKRRTALREKMFAAMGEFPAKPCGLEPRVVGVLKHETYSIEKVVFQSRPNVLVTASVYVPKKEGHYPAILVVHGHWPWARRDPVVQSRCLGLVKLGFLVVAVDAFGAGERFTNPGRGTYHGALYGSSLWPVGQSLLGMQVYDNRRAVDYILSRPEANGKLGVTGASGGGNQSMYAGALDERIHAAAPVCSVGNYQAYLKTACCVCEVLPGALQFTEEGDVLGLTAPRALLVINAAKDGIQFSPAEAAKSVERARHIYKLLDVESKLKHQVFDSTHDYNQPMREAMYGWMTLHLKGEGKGGAISEPKLEIEKPEDLACYPSPSDRPKSFSFPPTFAAAVGKELVAKADKFVPDHKEMWEAAAPMQLTELKRLLGRTTLLEPVSAEIGKPTQGNDRWENLFRLKVEGDLILAGRANAPVKPTRTAQALLFDFQGKEQALKHPIAKALLDKEWLLYALDLRGVGDTKPLQGAIGGAPDHHVAEHAVWIGRPLLAQWVTDIAALMNWLSNQYPNEQTRAVVGIGHAALPALVAGALFPDQISAVIVIDGPASLLSETTFAAGTPMGLLSPALLKAGDIPHIASLIAPRRLIVAGGMNLNGRKLTETELQNAFGFTKNVYKATNAAERVTISADLKWDRI